MKHVVVTGACGGMGMAVCRLLAEKGYCVWGLDIACGQPCAGVHVIPTDVTDAASVAAAFAQVAERTDRLEAIVHTAGLYDMNSLVEMDEAAFRRIFDINLSGVYRINKAFLPLLTKGGRIIITTSELAPLDPLPFTGIYSITKAALEKYAYSLRMELALLDIHVAVIRPGAVETKFLSASTTALDRFCGSTALYTCNADRFRRIVNSVESRSVPPEKMAKTICRAVFAKRPRYVYAKNRNPLLLLLNALPHRLQVSIIQWILKS